MILPSNGVLVVLIAVLVSFKETFPNNTNKSNSNKFKALIPLNQIQMKQIHQKQLIKFIIVCC